MGDEWCYNPANGHIVDRVEPTKLIPFNYVVFSISRYEGP